MEKEKKPKDAPKGRSCKVCGKDLPTDTDPSTPPFCSELCKLNDLSKWFGEQYRIASQRVPSSEAAPDEGQDRE